MSSAFSYTQAARLAHDLISYFGAAALVTRRVEGAYDPATATASISNRTYSATACFLNIRDKRETDSIQRGQRRALISPLSAYEPLVGDQIKIGALKYQITHVEKLAPAGSTVLYDCEVAA